MGSSDMQLCLQLSKFEVIGILHLYFIKCPKFVINQEKKKSTANCSHFIIHISYYFPPFANLLFFFFSIWWICNFLGYMIGPLCNGLHFSIVCE
jgi:hypothetical protein